MNTDELFRIVDRGNFVILDTKTTGLSRPAEVCQVAVINPVGDTLLDSYVCTRNPIPGEATAIHGITDDMVRFAPTWPVFKDSLLSTLKGKDVLVYNAKFDRHMLHCSDDTWELDETNYKAASNWHCVMLWYADVFQEWDDYHQNNRWQKLSNAIVQVGLEPDNAHNALGDCRMTLRLVLKVLGQEMPDFGPNT